MGAMKVPRHLQQFALMVGIILALIFRGIFIALGAAAINRFSWVFFLFGAFLIYTAVKLVIDYRNHDDDERRDAGQPGDAVREEALQVRRRVPRHEADGEAGRQSATSPRCCSSSWRWARTDLLFALDSIPAIYGLTQEPYLVFTANVFALMGLRQLYFLIGGLLKRLVYLSLGLSVILAFIGVKLILHALHHYHLADWAPWDGEIPIWVSLSVIIVTLVDHHRGQPGQEQVRRRPAHDRRAAATPSTPPTTDLGRCPCGSPPITGNADSAGAAAPAESACSVRSSRSGGGRPSETPPRPARAPAARSRRRRSSA